MLELLSLSRGRDLFETGPCMWWANVHSRSSTRKSGRQAHKALLAQAEGPYAHTQSKRRALECRALVRACVRNSICTSGGCTHPPLKPMELCVSACACHSHPPTHPLYRPGSQAGKVGGHCPKRYGYVASHFMTALFRNGNSGPNYYC